MTQEYNGFTIPAYTDAADAVVAFQNYTDDVTTKLAAKANLSGATYTGTHNFTGATVTGVPSGTQFLGSFTASAATSIVANNVFTSSYSVFKMFYVATTSGNDFSCNLRLRASGTDATGSDYRSQLLYGQNAAAGVSLVQDSFAVMNLDNDYPNTYAITLINPNSAAPTGIHGTGFRGYATGQGVSFTGIHNVSTAYDGFDLYASTAFTATVYLYGLRNS